MSDTGRFAEYCIAVLKDLDAEAGLRPGWTIHDVVTMACARIAARGITLEVARLSEVKGDTDP